MHARAALVLLAVVGGCGRFGFEGTQDGAVGESDAGTFAFRKPISIAPGQNAAGIDLANITIAVRVTDPDLRMASADGRLESGVDLAFLAADGVTPLAFEVESLSLDAGDLLAWIRLPVLSTSASTTFYLAFGNRDATTALDDRAATWSEYTAVWHFSEAGYTGAAGESIDARGTHNGKAAGGATTRPDGKLGRAASLPGNCSFIAIDASTALQPTSITVSAWVRPADIGVDPNRIATIVAQDSWRATGTGSQGYYLEIYRTVSQPEPTFYAANGPELAHAFATSTAVANDSWYHLAGTYDESTGVSSIYVNGALAGTAAMSGPIDYLARPVQIGCGPSGWWRGAIDEVMIAPFAMSPGQIATLYANQVDPVAFMTLGPTEPTP